MIEIVVQGQPKGKGRPCFNRATGAAYTPTATQRAEQRIQTEWIALGRPRLSDGPLAACIEVVVARPQAHLLKDGSLSAAGLRTPIPLRKPDADNAAKLALDALGGLAYRDDVQIADMRVIRRWALPGEPEQMRIVVWEMQCEAEGVQAA